MVTIEMSQEMNKKLDEHRAKLSAMVEALRPYASERDQRELEELCVSFEKRCANVLQENRLLNIGIVGQVKAGKSSFLNTLLFGGKTVLPKAATPKTAVLTRIEYGLQNKIVVQYISESDWRGIEKNAKADSDAPDCRAAREIVAAQKDSGVTDLSRILGKTEECPFDSVDELENRLNDFVGDNGKYTPLTLCVTVKLNLPELKSICVVDTPGMNDSVVSRTLQTREFLKVCDVVFFLSQSSQFLDASDWQLLFDQFPQSGIKKLVLIGSKIDSPLRNKLQKPKEVIDPLTEELTKIPGVSLKEGLDDLRQELTWTAKESVERNGSKLNEQEKDVCSRPIFISSTMENMRLKSEREYAEDEKRIDGGFADFYDGNRQEWMEEIAGFAPIRADYDKVVREKESILQKALDDLLPDAGKKRDDLLKALRERAENEKNALSRISQKQVDARREELDRQVNGLLGSVSENVQNIVSKLEKKKNEIISDVDQLSVKVQERTGTDREWHEGYTTYKHQILFIKWGKVEHPGYWETSYYQYIRAADASEALQEYARGLSKGLNKVFQDTLDVPELRNNMLRAVADNLDTSANSFDVGLCRSIAVNTLNEIEIPALTFEFDGLDDIRRGFSEEIRSTTEKKAFQSAIDKQRCEMLKKACNITESRVSAFKETMQQLPEKFTKRLRENILQEYNQLLEQSKKLEESQKRYEQYLDEIEHQMK